MKKESPVATVEPANQTPFVKEECGDTMWDEVLAQPTLKSTRVHYKTISIDGVNIFYREAGDRSKPAILLLHGFPSSSHMYRDLIADLAGSFYLVAPDYPGFGNSDMPDKNKFNYSFDNFAFIVEQFIDAIGLKKFSLFIQDYGSPVGFRIATKRPDAVQALIIQNGNAYMEGIGPAFADIPPFWKNRNAETEKPVRAQLTLEGTKFQYLDGVEDVSKISPDSYHYDQYFLDRKGNSEIQMDLFYDYQNNVALYPAWHQYLKTYQPPVLLTWGKNDQFFTEAGARAYLQHVPGAELHLFNTGHFALEEFHQEIAVLIRRFFENKAIK